jgi:hypothetical protein
MRIARLTVPRTAPSLTSLPVRGALQVNEREPRVTEMARLMRSTQKPVGGLGDDHRVGADIGERERIGAVAHDRERGVEDRREGSAHTVGVDHGTVQHGGREERLHAVAAADLDRHDGIETPAQIRLHRQHRPGDHAWVGEPLLADQWRAHLRDHRDQIVVGELQRVDQRDPAALTAELLDVEQAVIGIAAAAGAEDPGAGGEVLQLVLGDDAAAHAGGAPSNTERNSRSKPKARGPTWRRPFSVISTGGAGSAITVTRWP